MTNPNFEFPVRIYVGGKERPGHARGNEWFVPLRKGETYEIYVENRSGQPVCMRLLVDGLNTLPDLEMAKTKGVATFVWGQHVSLEDCAALRARPGETARLAQDLAGERVHHRDRGEREAPRVRGQLGRAVAGRQAGVHRPDGPDHSGVF